ncbi:MAG TPA: hypothetical protein VFA20_00705 [Myxococcaceae bacterium]|nr:hypothetical protein [Myxococcaceae bacterium]
MSSIISLVLKSTLLTLVLGLLMLGWLRTVWAYTQTGLTGSADRRAQVTQVQHA